LKSLVFFWGCFVNSPATKQISGATKPLFLLAQNSGNAAWLSRRPQERRTTLVATSGDSQMRILSFILAMAFVIAGPSIAGSSDNGLPGVGTFAYDGPPIVPMVPSAIVVAAR
jgi:hypothetical protein